MRQDFGLNFPNIFAASSPATKRIIVHNNILIPTFSIALITYKKPSNQRQPKSNVLLLLKGLWSQMPVGELLKQTHQK